MINIQIKLTEFSELITRYTADFVRCGWLVVIDRESLNHRGDNAFYEGDEIKTPVRSKLSQRSWSFSRSAR
jgi:hypothetical protein